MAPSSAFLSTFLIIKIILVFSLSSFNKINAANGQYNSVQVKSLLPHSVCNSSPKGPSKGGSLKVVHRLGPCSPLSQDTANIPTLTQILSHDQSRVHSIQARVSSKYVKTNLNDFKASPTKKNIRERKADLPAQPGSVFGTGNYVVTVGLGSPKKALSLVFDTGSDLTWTQCQPCVKSCYTQQQPIFDPSTSSTYTNISCTSAQCTSLTSATGNSPGCSASNCVYGIQYGDSSFSVGFFGKEKLTLVTDEFNGFLFGCGQNNRGLFGKTAGLLGLGRHPLSIVSQTSQKYGKYFSYCLPTSSSSTGHLTFGKSTVSSSVKFTPFSTSQGASFYYIDLLAISVAGKQLAISGTVFKTAGTIIDSGTVITRLPPAAYKAMRDAFKQLMTSYPTAPAFSLLDTCYDLSKYTSVTVPKISFYFNGNVKLDLTPQSTLVAASTSQVCLAFAGNSDATDVGIFGNVQQQGVEVIYDVAGGKLGFGPGGC